MVDGLQILVADTDAPMRHVSSQQPGIQGAVNKISFAESKGIVSENSFLHPLFGVLGDGFPLFDEGPVGPDPRGLDKFVFHTVLAPRRVKCPLTFAGRILQDTAAAALDDGFPDGLVAFFEGKNIPSGVDNDEGFIGSHAL